MYSLHHVDIISHTPYPTHTHYFLIIFFLIFHCAILSFPYPYCISGEDIGESDDEDDEEGNELEYDEFLRHDNDFGSDADSDGMCCTCYLVMCCALWCVVCCALLQCATVPFCPTYAPPTVQ